MLCVRGIQGSTSCVLVASVERLLAMQKVAGSNPVSRSIFL